MALLDETGAVVERYGYDPFGAPSIYNADATATLSQSAVSNTRLYTGRDYLPALGLYDLRQRAYDPVTGRFLTTDPIGPFGDTANLGNPYTYVANNPGSFVDPFGEERWGAQSYFADVAEVAHGYFIGGPAAVVAGAATAILHPIQTVQGIASLAGGLATDPLDTAGGLAGQFYEQFEDSDTAGQAAFGAATAVVPGAAGAAKAATAASNSGRGLIIATQAAKGAAGEAASAGRAALRARVLSNIKRSEAANGVSQFDVHLATEEIYANANKAVTIARDAGLTNKNGALGMRAHKEFAGLNAATREKLSGREIWIEIEPYVDPWGNPAIRGARGSLSVDALLKYRGANVRGFDLKTGRPWSRAGALERETRFNVPMQQIQR